MSKSIPNQPIPHGTPNGYGNYKCRCDECKEANSDYYKAYRVENGEEMNRQARERHTGERRETRNSQLRRLRKDRKTIINKMKVDAGCIVCGFKDHRALDFDHVRGEKLFDIATAVHEGRAWELILAEIKKCEIVCANHHRIRTVQRLEESELDKDVDITNQCVSTDEQINAHKAQTETKQCLTP